MITKINPYDVMPDKITCPINQMHDYLENGDLDSEKHFGITVGNGKQMYWYLIWHGSSGNITLYTSGKCDKKRYIKNDQIITIHFKPNKP